MVSLESATGSSRWACVRVSAKDLESRRFIRGKVTRFVSWQYYGSFSANWLMISVGDADNFRLYHTPGFGWRLPFKFRSVPTTPKGMLQCGPYLRGADYIWTELKDQTLHIRLAGVDAPEAAHLQVFSATACNIKSYHRLTVGEKLSLTAPKLFNGYEINSWVT